MLYKRGNVYWIDLQVGQKRVRRSTGTIDRAKAKAFHKRIEDEAYNVEKLGAKAKRTFDEVALRWLQEKAHKRSIKTDAERMRFWIKECEGMTLDEITGPFIQDAVKDMKTVHDRPAAAATKNRYMQLIRSVLRKAIRWGYIDHPPVIDLLPENNRRTAYFTPEQARKLLAVLPPEQKAPVAFAFMTGLRKSNVYSLRWDQVDLPRGVAWLHADQVKTGRNLAVPLNTDAKALLAGLAETRPDGQSLVFNGVKPILSRSWQRYLQVADLPASLRFHDTRHSFASWHIMAGTDQKTLQELCGWASPKMLERYVHLSVDHLADASERLVGKVRYISDTYQNQTSGVSAVTH